MLNLKEIEDILWQYTVREVDIVCENLGISKTGIKETKINKIIEFYNKENWVEDNYNSLNEYERALIDNLTQQNFNPTRESIEKIKAKYVKSKLKLTRYHYFHLNGKIPRTIKEHLKKIVPELKIEFSPVKEEIIPEDYYAYVIGREDRIEDFDALLKFISINKIKPTTKNRTFPKSALLKYHDNRKYMDVIRDEAMFMADIKNIKDTTVSYGMISLLESGAIIDSSKEYFKLGGNYKYFITLNKIEKFRRLLERYLNAASVFINEITRIKRALFQQSIKYPDLSKPRQFILDMIKLLPLDSSWINGDDFREAIRMKDYNFLRKHTGSILVRDNYYNQYYDSPSFYELECGFIDICLTEYFATIGIIDVILEHRWDDYDYRDYLEVKYLRLTELGAILLGKKEIVQDVEEDHKFTITDNFEIIVPNGSKKLEYELFFERFLKEVSSSSESTTYEIDFPGLAKAYDLGISIASIIEYMEENAISFSENVKYQLKEWKKMAGKVSIKTVTIMEYPKELEKLLFHPNKLDKYLDKNHKEIAIINKSKKQEVKKCIEKSEVFCQIDN